MPKCSHIHDHTSEPCENEAAWRLSRLGGSTHWCDDHANAMRQGAVYRPVLTIYDTVSETPVKYGRWTRV